MRIGAIALVSMACGCASFPKERGERLEQRLQRLEDTGDAGQLDGERAAALKQIQQLEARVAELQKTVDALASASKPGSGADGAGAPELTAQLGRQETALEEQARRVAAIEKTLASLQLREEREPARAAARTPRPAARAAPEPPPRPGPGPDPAAPAASGEVPRDKAGYLAFARAQETKGQKDLARDLYEQYVASFPDDPGAAEAHFRLGELAFAQKHYREAINEYSKVAQGFPRSGQAPDALLRTAESMVHMGLKDEAVTVLTEVPRRYPGTPAASRAERRLSELGRSSRDER
jgi:tol-pal system protein YbgF